MAKRDHYLAADLKKSTLTKHVQTIRGMAIYSHRVTSIAGSFVVLWNDTDWEAYERFDLAKRAVVARVMARINERAKAAAAR